MMHSEIHQYTYNCLAEIVGEPLADWIWGRLYMSRHIGVLKGQSLTIHSDFGYFKFMPTSVQAVATASFMGGAHLEEYTQNYLRPYGKVIEFADPNSIQELEKALRLFRRPIKQVMAFNVIVGCIISGLALAILIISTIHGWEWAR